MSELTERYENYRFTARQVRFVNEVRGLIARPPLDNPLELIIDLDARESGFYRIRLLDSLKQRCLHYVDCKPSRAVEIIAACLGSKGE